MCVNMSICLCIINITDSFTQSTHISDKVSNIARCLKAFIGIFLFIDLYRHKREWDTHFVYSITFLTNNHIFTLQLFNYKVLYAQNCITYRSKRWYWLTKFEYASLYYIDSYYHLSSMTNINIFYNTRNNFNTLVQSHVSSKEKCGRDH